ncbi:MAG: hypothetical protein M1825_002489 [Sarcosagium campestre]|nr:MAG: hypothetical protein M1825_002489 [Sarcosagium campestre]
MSMTTSAGHELKANTKNPRYLESRVTKEGKSQYSQIYNNYRIDRSSCSRDGSLNIVFALRDVHDLIQAGIIALNEVTVNPTIYNPASYFFGAGGDEQGRLPAIDLALARLTELAETFVNDSDTLPPPSPRVTIVCGGSQAAGHCDRPDDLLYSTLSPGPRANPADADQHVKNADDVIVLCKTAVELGRNIKPCGFSARPPLVQALVTGYHPHVAGGVTLPLVLLEQILQLRRTTMLPWKFKPREASQLRAYEDKRPGPFQNTYPIAASDNTWSLAWMAKWSWDVGYVADSSALGVCLHHFAPWNPLVPSSWHLDPGQDRPALLNDLNSLLVTPDQAVRADAARITPRPGSRG